MFDEDIDTNVKYWRAVNKIKTIEHVFSMFHLFFFTEDSA